PGGRARVAGHDASAAATTAGDLACRATAGLSAVKTGTRVAPTPPATRTGNAPGHLHALVHRVLPVGGAEVHVPHFMRAGAVAGKAACLSRAATAGARDMAATTAAAARHPATAAAAAARELFATVTVAADLLHANDGAIEHAALRRQRIPVGLS